MPEVRLQYRGNTTVWLAYTLRTPRRALKLDESIAWLILITTGRAELVASLSYVDFFSLPWRLSIGYYIYQSMLWHILRPSPASTRASHTTTSRGTAHLARSDYMSG